MKKSIIYILLLSIFMSCVQATKETPSFSVKELTFTGGGVGQPQTVKIRAAGEWAIREATIPEWLAISPLSGLDYGDITIKTLSVNSENKDRSFELLLNVVGFNSIGLNIIQKFGTPEELTDGMLNKNTEGYYKNGKEVFILDPKTMQVGYNLSIKNYFIISDNQSKILSLNLNSTSPILYEEEYITIQSRGLDVDTPESAGCIFYQKKDGKLWYYDINKKVGFIIRDMNE